MPTTQYWTDPPDKLHCPCSTSGMSKAAERWDKIWDFWPFLIPKCFNRASFWGDWGWVCGGNLATGRSDSKMPATKQGGRHTKDEQGQKHNATGCCLVIHPRNNNCWIVYTMKISPQINLSHYAISGEGSSKQSYATKICQATSDGAWLILKI